MAMETGYLPALAEPEIWKVSFFSSEGGKGTMSQNSLVRRVGPGRFDTPATVEVGFGPKSKAVLKKVEPDQQATVEEKPQRRAEMKSILLTVCVAVLVLAGCARIYVPPAIDLDPYQVIGLIEFSSDTKGDLTEYVTQRFIESITEDQEELRIVELGDEATVLAAIDQASLGPDAFKAIGEKYDVNTVFTGVLNVSDVTPSISIGPGFGIASFEAKVNARLIARLVETETGATLWTNSGTEERTVAGVSKFGSTFSFDAQDPEHAYGDLARGLCRKVTRDFRHTWRNKCL